MSEVDTVNGLTVENSLRANQTTQEEHRWMEAAKRGDAEALEQFYTRYREPIYRLCYRMLGRASDAEDAMQNAFVQAFRALPTFRGDCQIRTWLYRIATNESIQLLRRRGDAPVLLDPMASAPDSTRPLAERLAVQATLLGLKPDYRAILILRYWEELSYEEIASVLRLPMPAMKMRLFRARAAFERLYERE